MWRFADWCGHHGIPLAKVEPMVVAAYVEELTGKLAPASVKQHLAAIRMLFDWLVVGQVLPFNPASSVRGPKHVVRKGKTPVLSVEEARGLLDGIDLSTLAGLRDRALIGVLVFSFARITAAVSMRVAGYYTQGKRSFFRLYEKGDGSTWCRRTTWRRNTWMRISRRRSWGRTGRGRFFGATRSAGRTGWRTGR